MRELFNRYNVRVTVEVYAMNRDNDKVVRNGCVATPDKIDEKVLALAQKCNGGLLKQGGKEDGGQEIDSSDDNGQ